MKKTNTAFLLGLSALFISQLAFAADPTVSIPLKTFINPTFDLMDQKGTKLYSSDLDRLFRQGVDLSKLNPAENNYWQNGKYPAIDANLHSQMPGQNDEVIYDSSVGAYREANIYSLVVTPKTNTNLRYGLTFGLQVHSSLIKSALLRKIGIYQESPKYLHKIKVRFASAEQMDNFITTAFNVEGSKEDNPDYLSLEPFQRGLISDVNKADATLVLHGAYLEKMNASVPSLFDGLTPTNSSNANYFAQSRAYRSLIIPFVIGDLGESLNRVSTQSATLRGGSVVMNFVNSHYFAEKTSEADAKWILRLIAGLTDQDWTEIVAAGEYPVKLRPLVKMKLMYRTKNLLENFFSKDEVAQIFKGVVPSIEVNSGDGCVEHSKVMPVCANIPGYPQRWAHGDRQSPFETSDFLKYLNIRTQASFLKEALSKLSTDYLQKKKMKFDITGIEFSPQGIAALGSATVTSIDGGYTADRIITTGTYYGSQAPIQLVDSISMTGAASYQKLFFGRNAISKTYGANIGYSRDFTYVTPIKSIEEAKKQPRRLWGPSKLNDIVEPLEKGNNLTKFLSQLQEGEVFTITDSIGVMGRAGISKTLENLAGFTSLGNPSIALSVDATESVILRQTQVIRTAEGIQIFIRDGNALMFGVQFDFDYFVNLLKIRYQTASTDLHTEAYLVNYNASLMNKIESGELQNVSDSVQKIVDAQNAISEKASQAILALIRSSNTWPMRENFKYTRYEINHYLKTTEIQKKFLWFKATKMDEEHILSIYKPELVVPEGSRAVNEALKFSLYQRGELKGSDKFGFGLEVFDATLAKKVPNFAPSFSQNSQNPSQMPYGKAYWRMVRSDSDLKADRSTALPSVASVDHVWSGWSIKQADLQSIVQELRANLKNVDASIANNATIPDGALYHTKKIDFYRITSHLTLLPEALDVIKNIILAPEAANLKMDKVGFVARIFQKLSEAGGNKARPQDKVVYNNIMKILGNGDEKAGLQAYLEECRANQVQGRSSDGQPTPVSTWSKGTSYECLEAWTEKLIKLSRNFPTDVRAQNRWMSDVLYVLDEKIPQGYLMNALGKDKFIYYVDFAGFRVGDEDGDDGIYTPFVLGEPTKKSDYGNGLISLLTGKYKLKIVPTELMTTRLSAQ